MTACKDCKHLEIMGDKPNIWYNQKCLAVRERSEFDCYSGEIRKGRQAYCRDVNTGHCEHFEEREDRDERESLL